MDKKLLLINAITLLYRESQLENNVGNSSDLVKALVEGIPLPEVSVGAIDTERDQLAALKHIAFEMCNNDQKHTYEPVEVLQKIRHAAGGDESLYHSFREGIEPVMDETGVARFCKNLRKTIIEYQAESKLHEIIQKSAVKLKFHRETIPDLKAYAADLMAELEPFQAGGKAEDPAIVGQVDMKDKEGIKKNFKAARELNNDDGIMRTGWQGFNRMLQGGFRRGETWVLGALQHNAKTLVSLTLFKQIALYNKPFMLNPNKKPLLLRISFEDPLTLNLPYLYRNIYENETGQPVQLDGLSDDEIAEYVMQKLGVNGYEIKLLHVNPSLWTYRDICNKVLELEGEGYEIHMLMLDYLGMIPTTGCIQTGPTGSDKRDLFRRMRNFCSAKKITLVTPHQLSTEAKMLIRQGMDADFVKEVANKGYYDGCRTIDQEVDGEIYFHKVIEDGKAWLTFQRGKHRLIKQTPEADKYMCLQFHEVGDLRDDFGKEESTYRKPGGTLLSSKETRSHFDFSPA